MVRTCCVVGCNVRSYDRHGNKVGLSFYAFPTWKQHEGAHVSDVTKRRRLAWIAAVRRADIKFCYVSRYQLVCSRHFHSDDVEEIFKLLSVSLFMLLSEEMCELMMVLIIFTYY
uniref:THAP-type domain-containing protein n=1 Tax=Pundamilia nyererei TaxID=303518 RepID=A0A3B4H1E8_9CICH